MFIQFLYNTKFRKNPSQYFYNIVSKRVGRTNKRTRTLSSKLTNVFFTTCKKKEKKRRRRKEKFLHED